MMEEGVNPFTQPTPGSAGPSQGSNRRPPQPTTPDQPPMSPGRPQLTRRGTLLARVEVPGSEVYCAKCFPRSGGDSPAVGSSSDEPSVVVTAANDRMVRIWVKRETGQYWPVTNHVIQNTFPTCIDIIPGPPSPLSASSSSATPRLHRLLTGTDSGSIIDMSVELDYTGLKSNRLFLAHSGRVEAVVYAAKLGWILSCGRDKYLQAHDASTGQRLGGYQCNGWAMDIAHDSSSGHVFVGDYSGEIHMVKCDPKHRSLHLITSFKGHNGAVHSLAWDKDKQMLFSGASDAVVIAWDVGSRKGTAYELQGHSNRVRSLCLVSSLDLLFSGAEDSIVAIWDMSADRREAAAWSESNACELCNRPFFWNIKAMMDSKTLGLRQHHCRRCGRAICHTCSSTSLALPSQGFEYPVRVCDHCKENVQPDELEPKASFLDVKHGIVSVSVDLAAGRLVTLGTDKNFKAWDLPDLLAADADG